MGPRTVVDSARSTGPYAIAAHRVEIGQAARPCGFDVVIRTEHRDFKRAVQESISTGADYVQLAHLLSLGVVVRSPDERRRPIAGNVVPPDMLARATDERPSLSGLGS